MTEKSTKDNLHFTTRRGFIAAVGFGVVGLYGLWAAYGAAPLSLLAGSTEETAPAAEGHGGHGATAGPSPEEFMRLADQFFEANKLPDGSVYPRRKPSAPGKSTMPEHAGPGAQATTERAMHGAAHSMESQAPPIVSEAVEAHAGEEPVDIYLMVYQWGYHPAVLRLEANVPYRFRMMALDTTHGASLHLGNASRIIRLRAKTLVEQELKFTKTGEYLLYCTVYCGLSHHRMQGKIIVAEAQPGGSHHG